MQRSLTVVSFILFYSYCKKKNYPESSKQKRFISLSQNSLLFFLPTKWVVSHFQVVSPISLGKRNFMQCNSDLHSHCARELISQSSGQKGKTLQNYLVSVIFPSQCNITLLWEWNAPCACFHLWLRTTNIILIKLL